jgi:RNA polymerase sigma factor (sigma-70 family)
MLGLSTDDNPRHLPDEELLLRSRVEPWLFSLIVERYEAPFFRKVRTIIRDQRDVEEVVQDAFVKMYVKADSYTPQPGATFSSWAYRILLNTAFTRYQKLRKEGERFMATDPEFMEFLAVEESLTVVNMDRDAIERVLARMPGGLAHVLRLHYLERWSHRDIGESLGENEGTIKARIHRAKAAFRKLISGKEAETML